MPSCIWLQIQENQPQSGVKAHHHSFSFLPTQSLFLSYWEEKRVTDVWKTPPVENVFTRPMSELGDERSLACGKVWWCITRKKGLGKGFRSKFWKGRKRRSYRTRENIWDKQLGLDPYRAQRTLLTKLEGWTSLHQSLQVYIFIKNSFNLPWSSGVMN